LQPYAIGLLRQARRRPDDILIYATTLLHLFDESVAGLRNNSGAYAHDAEAVDQCNA